MPHVHSSSTVAMPSIVLLARDICLNVGESVIAPLVVFYAVLVAGGLHPALLAATAWALLAIVVRLGRRQRPPVLLLVATAFALLRVAMSWFSGSAVVYFLQPTVTTYLFAAAVLLTVHLERPLIQRLATDFCPLPGHVVKSASMRRFFRWLSLLWGTVLLGNASITLVMLLTLPPVRSVPVATAASAPLFVMGLATSVWWFRRSLRNGGFTLTWGARPVATQA